MSLSTETPTIVLSPFRAEDAYAMELTRQAIRSLTGVDTLENFRLYEAKGPGWTLRIEEQIIGCAGLMFPWPSGSLAIAWLLPSPHLARYPLTAIKLLLDKLRALITEYQPRRVEFLVDASFRVGQRFAEWLEFRRDGCCDPPCPQCGVVRAYGPQGEDYIRYVWVREP
jgi:RimJ/RimL family protein N-acetyltransferase